MKLLLVILKNAWFVIKNYFGWIIRYSKKQNSYSIQHRYERLRNFLVEFGKRLNLKLYVSGLENIKDDENYFFTPNHQGILDPLLWLSKKLLHLFVNMKVEKYLLLKKQCYLLMANL